MDALPDETNSLPGEATSHDDRLEMALADVLRRAERGEYVDRQALLQQHPDLAEDLQEFFANQQLFQRAIQPPTTPTGVAARLRYFGDYELLDEIAHGGMGVVYKARQTSLNRLVAIKMILAGHLANDQEVKRFQAEAEAAANLHHPGVVAIHEVGIHNGQHYYSMEYVAGRDLAALVREKPIGFRQSAEYLRDIAEIVEFAHSQGVLHRDLKPSNILIDSTGRVRVTDFGLAKRVQSESDLTITGQILGTPSYMSPEQAAAQHAVIGPASDVYSLGTVLYELLTGRPPFRSDNLGETLRQVQQEEPVRPRLLNPKLPRDLETICLKCLEKESRQRYATAQELADELGRFLRGEPIHARPIGSLARTWRWCKRQPVVAGLSALSSAAVAVTIAILVYSQLSIAEAFGKLQLEQKKTSDALTQKTEALGEKSAALTRLSIEERNVRDALNDKTTALADKTAALQRERVTAYANLLTLARREWLDGRLARCLELLDACHPDLRHWEWHYLRRMCDPQPYASLPFKGGLTLSNRLPITGNGKQLLSYDSAADAERALLFCDTSTGNVVRKLALPDPPGGQLAISGDGQTCFSAVTRMVGISHLSDLVVRDAQSGRTVFTAELPDFAVDSLAINADGTLWAASGSVWQPGAKSTGVYHTRIWKRESPGTPFILPDAPGSRTLVFSPDGSRLVASHMTGFSLFETGDWALLATASAGSSGSFHSIFGTAPCFRDDSRQFAFAAGSVAAVFDAATGTRIRNYHLQKPDVSAISFGADNRKLAYGTTHGNVVLLDLDSGQEDVALRLPLPIRQLQYSSDGSRLVTLDDKLRIWDAKVSPAYDAISTTVGHSHTATFDSSGTLAASLVGSRSVFIWQVATREVKLALTNFLGELYDVAFSPDGRFLATAGHDGVEVWDVQSGALWYRFVEAVDKRIVYADRVCFSQQGNWLVGGHDHGATIWDLEKGTEVRSFGVETTIDWVSSAVLTADASRLATCGHNGKVQLWDTSSGAELFCFDDEEVFYTLALSPSERQIAACGPDSDIYLLDAHTGVQTGRLAGHANGANTIAYSQDGKRLVSAGRDGVIKIWDAESGLELLSLETGGQTCYSASFSPDSRRLVTTDMDTLRFWDAAVSPSADRAQGP